MVIIGDSTERPKAPRKESAPAAEGEASKDGAASKGGKKNFRHGEKMYSKDGAELVDGKSGKRRFDRRR